MSLPVTLACLWVLATAAIALLPIRRQILPGIVLIALALVLLVWLVRDHGPWIVLPVVAVLLSMFRRPIVALIRLAIGRVRSGSQDNG
jgi:O-antigen ligase